MAMIEIPTQIFNETTTNLGIGATFTGVARQFAQLTSNVNWVFADMNNFNVHFISDQVSAANWAQIQWSQDGSTNWKIVAQTALTASTPVMLSVPITFPFYRVVLINGGVATTSLSITSSGTL